jgi:hypothetical protein
MKGYWINHVIDIKDPERFGAYAEASMPMFQGDNQYGAKILLFGPVAATGGIPSSMRLLPSSTAFRPPLSFGTTPTMPLPERSWDHWTMRALWLTGASAALRVSR